MCWIHSFSTLRINTPFSSFQAESCRETHRSKLTFPAHKLLTTRETCIALRILFFFSLGPLLQGPLPGTGRSLPTPAPRLAVRSPGRVPGLPPQLPARDQGAGVRPRRHWACSEAAAGAGLLRRRSHSAAGGRAAAAGAPAPGVGVAGSFPPTPPSWRAAAGAGAGAASGGEPAPGPAKPCPEPGARSPARGSPRGGASPAGTRAAHWHCPGTSRAAR